MSAEKFTLLELAKRHDQLAPSVPDGSPFLTGHRLAAMLHGWTSHEYHHGEIKLTDSDYLAAIKASWDGKSTHQSAVPEAPKPAESIDNDKQELAIEKEEV